MKLEVTLPSLGDDANDKAEVALWCVNVGEAVAEGADLLEVTTDKAAFTLPSPRAGALVEIRKREGETVAAGDIVCVLEV